MAAFQDNFNYNCAEHFMYSSDENDFDSTTQMYEPTNECTKSRNAKRRQRQGAQKRNTKADPRSRPRDVEITAVRKNVFDLILNQFKGCCTIQELIQRNIFSENTDGQAIKKWLSRDKFKVIPGSRDFTLSIVKIFDRRFRLCYNYPYKCYKKDCRYFHLCRGFVLGTCTRKINGQCGQAHSFFHNEHNMALVDQFDLSDFSNDQLRCILANSTIRVCSDYNKSECLNICLEDTITCKDVHICAAHVRNECVAEDPCPYDHKLKTSGTNKLLKIYNMMQLQDETIMKMLLVPEMREPKPVSNKKPGTGVNKSAPWKTPGNVTAFSYTHSRLNSTESPTAEDVLSPTALTTFTLSQENLWICEAYLRNACTSGANCDKIHYILPFLWLAKQGTGWDLIKDNEGKERSFCEVNNQQFGSMRFFSMGDSGSEIGYREPIALTVNLKRISTPSFSREAKHAENSFYTVWLWYWLDNGNMWKQYNTHETCKPYQDIIEASFHKYQRQKQNLEPEKSSDCELKYLHFETAEFRYRIDFEKMIQENLATGTERKLQRRPWFVSSDAVATKKGPLKPVCHFMANLINFRGCPWVWVPMDTKTIRGHQKIQLRTGPEFKAIEKTFFTTLDKSAYEIVEILRFQNLSLWKNYERKRKEMMKSQSGFSVVNEKRLFHGTPDEVAMRCIANQGFDPRMSGKHGTVYGLGAYFARDAKYSNNYTDRKGGMQFMFMARVLVGKHCKGDASMKRPPPLNESRPDGELYDSCVNNMQDPSIYVVFDSDQCYPELLIKYRQLPKPSACVNNF